MHTVTGSVANPALLIASSARLVQSLVTTRIQLATATTQPGSMAVVVIQKRTSLLRRTSMNDPESQKPEDSNNLKLDDDVKLYDADPNCQHEIVAQWSGIKCIKCNGWFCY